MKRIALVAAFLSVAACTRADQTPADTTPAMAPAPTMDTGMKTDTTKMMDTTKMGTKAKTP